MKVLYTIQKTGKIKTTPKTILDETILSIFIETVLPLSTVLSIILTRKMRKSRLGQMKSPAQGHPEAKSSLNSAGSDLRTWDKHCFLKRWSAFARPRHPGDCPRRSGSRDVREAGQNSSLGVLWRVSVEGSGERRLLRTGPAPHTGAGVWGLWGGEMTPAASGGRSREDARSWFL